MRIGRFGVTIKIVPRDIWIGVFIDKLYGVPPMYRQMSRKIYICILPCIPIILEVFYDR